MQRIGIIGGTFDPPHLGHLFIAEDARVRCGLSRVLFVPNRVPAHREGKFASAEAEARYAMTLAAVRDNPHFEVSRVELQREGPSYAFDTMRALREEFRAQEVTDPPPTPPEGRGEVAARFASHLPSLREGLGEGERHPPREETQLFFIVGADTISQVPTWYRGPELFGLCRFVAVSRPGFDWEAAQHSLSSEQRARVEWLQTPGLEIASREVRRRVGDGLPIRYLVPSGVEQEIVARRLYLR